MRATDEPRRRRRPRQRRRAEPALEGAGAGPLPPDRQHQPDHEEGAAVQRQDRKGRQGDGPGVRLRVYQLHHQASDKCQKEKRKTINGDDLLYAMATLGFEDYIEPLKVYLSKYREMEIIKPKHQCPEVRRYPVVETQKIKSSKDAIWFNHRAEASARNTLENVMAQALSEACSNRSAVRAVCLAVSGVNHPTDQQRILDWLRDIFPSHVKFFVENDAVAALASGTMGKLHGCVLIAGTGSIAYGFTEDGRDARAAGAGPILGDWGSGYGIAAQALTAVIKAHDGRGPKTMLTNNIINTLELSSPDELIGWTYADPSWARIAALVPVVVSSAEAGDDVANKILNASVQELADSVKAVVHRLQLCGEDGKHSFPLVMVGGVLEANKRWDIGKEVVDRISKIYPGVHPIRPMVEPAVGAALLAQNYCT